MKCALCGKETGRVAEQQIGMKLGHGQETAIAWNLPGYCEDCKSARQLPTQVIVKPRLIPLDDHEERYLVDGHTINAAGFVFVESGVDHIFYTDVTRLRAWLDANAYRLQSNLENRYMTAAGVDGIWIREGGKR